MKTAGVLALQGDFERHRVAVERAGARAMEVRTPSEIDACDALIIPGGESTTMLKLLEIEGLTEPLRRFGAAKPILGTCAGAILLARAVTHPVQPSLALMDIDVERNAYGRQIDSRIAGLEIVGEPVEAAGESPEAARETRRAAGEPTGEPAAQPMEAVFIRAPIIRRVGPGVTVLATYQGDPVWVAEGRHMATTFHPELTPDSRVHRRFLSQI